MTSTTTEREQVLVVATETFHSCGYFEGFTENTSRYLGVLLDPANTRYLPRDEMEQDPAYKQLIPYCIFRYTDNDEAVSVFQYTRGTKQGEARLHSKRSIGVGGHISTLDMGDQSAYEIGMHRELNEEVFIQTPCEQNCVGLINDDSNDVGAVHLGVVHLFDVSGPDVIAREAAMIDAGFRPVSGLLEELEQFETWSQICLKSLFLAEPS